MTDLEEIVKIAANICSTVDRIIQVDNRINVELEIALEKMRLDIERSTSNVMHIAHYYGA